jgi:hypothetical protein
MNLEHLMECELALKIDVLGDNQAHCHFVHQKLHMT